MMVLEGRDVVIPKCQLSPCIDLSTFACHVNSFTVDHRGSLQNCPPSFSFSDTGIEDTSYIVT